MKVKYIGETFYDGMGLTNGKIYNCIGIDNNIKCLEIIDDEGDECIYPIENPRPLDNSSEGGEWEIVEDPDNQLTEIFEELKLI